MMRRVRLLIAAGLLLGGAAPPHDEGSLPSGAHWTATVPAGWNGTLLLWSHGYRAEPRPAEDADARHRDALLAAGYALAGSDYAKPGWALAEAVPDQVATVAAFAARFGKPRRVIAWGNSMGGLVTTALVEREGSGIDAGVAFCASIGGAVGMMNMALDGAYVFRTLLAPQSDIRLTDTRDDRANAERAKAVLDAARATPAGRARVALAAVLAGIPGWTSADGAEPAPGDADAQQAEMARAFIQGVFLPRADQEARADGAFSWNDGIDYRAQLALSGRRKLVEALYRAADLDLEADLATLAAGPRTARGPGVAYMTAHYTPDARPRVPIAAVQMIGDGATSPSLQRGYAEAVAANGLGARLASLWIRGAGHCTFRTPTVLAAIRMVEARLTSGRWPARPDGFIAYAPPPMLRPCVRGGRCR